MFALKVELQERDKGSANQLASDAVVQPSPGGLEDLSQDTIPVSAGNPRVEHAIGVVHLYRELEDEVVDQHDHVHLPEARGTMLCVLAIPADMGIADFCKFVGGFLPSIRSMRVVRKDGNQSVCLIILQCSDQDVADELYLEYNGRPFSSLEPEILCRLVFVKDVQFTTDQAIAAQPGPGQLELPNCPVCLERLDDEVSGIVTTVCNHRFHNECLQRWGDTSCPVCRYCAQSSSSTSHCHSCGTSQDLWICLICGQVGCGRYRSKHAFDHWQESGHCYSLELETQRVWDYVRDGYVHRLVQSKTDGKLVEVPVPGGPGTESSSAGASQTCSRTQSGRLCMPGFCTPDTEDAAVKSQLETVAEEYNHLLVSQLESQRRYFEALQHKLKAEAEQRIDEAHAALQSHLHSSDSAQDKLKEAERQRCVLERRISEASSKHAALLKQAGRSGDLQALNEQLMRNQQAFQERLKAAEKRAEAAEMECKDLKDQLRDIMFALEAQQMAGASSDLQQATLLPVPPSPPEPRSRGAGRKGRR